MNAMTRHTLRSATIALLLLPSVAALAQSPGSFDTTWRPNGRIIVGASGATGFVPDVVAVLDDRVTVAGTCQNSAFIQGCAFRLDAAGNIDASWGDPFALNNVVRSDLVGLPTVMGGTAASYLSSVDSAGRVLWMLQIDNVPAPIGRLNASGTAASVASTPVDLLVGASGQQIALRLKAVGDHVYVAGAARLVAGSFDAVLARLGGDLRLDPAFNGSGVRRVAFDGAQATTDALQDFVVQPDGRIYGVASAQPAGGDRAFWLVCFNPDGSLDSSFGVGGRSQVPIANAQRMYIAVDGLGRIVLGGHYFAPGGFSDAYVARVTPQGAFDTSFGVGGVSRFGINGIANADDVALEVGVQPDGKPIIAGQTEDANARPLFVARLTESGALDAEFGTNGVLVGSFGGSLGNSSRDEVRRLQFDAAGRLYVAGASYNATFDIERVGVGRVVTGVVVEPPSDPVFADGFE
jgi:uncharacterized delta-60 repeat protein